MKYINANIDGLAVSVPKGTTIMQAGDKIGAHVPRLCYHPVLSTEGACRICIVEVNGFNHYLPACIITKEFRTTTNSRNSQIVIIAIVWIALRIIIIWRISIKF